MSEVLLPTWIIPEEETQEWLDEGSSVFGSAFAPGIAQRQSFGGLRLKMSRRHTVRGEEKAQLLSILNLTRGRYNALRTKVHFALRGAGFGSELLTNNTFANGTTGWNKSSNVSLSVADRALRSERTSYDNSNSALLLENTPAVSGLTQYAPYVFRAMVNAGRGVAGVKLLLGDSSFSGNHAASSTVVPGSLMTLATVVRGTTIFCGVQDTAINGGIAGDHASIPYMSLTQNALVDNAPNLFTKSDDFSHADWTKTNATVSADAVLDPFGTSGADALIDNGTSGVHEFSQSETVSANALEYCIGTFAKANSRNFVVLSLDEGATSTVSAWFNLSTGVKGSFSVGAGWGSNRSFIVNMGNGWYYCAMVARKTSSATSIEGRIGSANADSAATYSGSSDTAIYLFRGVLAQSSLPVRAAQTTTTASTGTSQTGNALHLKGLPASTNGLLLPGDYFEINGEIKQATAALNSDAAQLGYLQFEPALVRSPADNDPINVIDPMGKFLVSNINVDNQFGTQAVVTYDLEHVYE